MQRSCVSVHYTQFVLHSGCGERVRGIGGVRLLCAGAAAAGGVLDGGVDAQLLLVFAVLAVQFTPVHCASWVRSEPPAVGQRGQRPREKVWQAVTVRHTNELSGTVPGWR